MTRPIDPEFDRLLAQKQPGLQSLYRATRAFVLALYPDANELLYHTQALTSVYSPSLKLKHAYCHIPIYTEHLNLGFNFGARLDDPTQLLQGKGKHIRHVPIRQQAALENPALKALVEQAIAQSLLGLGEGERDFGRTVSKIKQA